MVNNIENNVSNAAEYISSAKEETKKAVRWQKKSRRVCFWSVDVFAVFSIKLTHQLLMLSNVLLTVFFTEIHYSRLCSLDPAGCHCTNRGPVCWTN